MDSLRERTHAGEGHGPGALNLLVASPEYVLAVRDNGRMVLQVLHGPQDLERSGQARMRLPNFAACRVSVVASDFENDDSLPGWTTVPDRAIVTLTRTEDPHIEPI